MLVRGTLYTSILLYCMRKFVNKFTQHHEEQKKNLIIPTVVANGDNAVDDKFRQIDDMLQKSTFGVFEECI